MSEQNHSQHEVNKMLRVLSDKRLKYTVRVHKPDGKVVEWQSDGVPAVEWHGSSRSLWLFQNGSKYETHPVMAWQDGMILLVEENPESK